MGEIVITSVGPVEVENYQRLPSREGTTRKVHMGTEWVYKVPKFDWGRGQNIFEANTWLRGKGLPLLDPNEGAAYVPVAECHLLLDGTLMMERVRTIRDIGWDTGHDWRQNNPDVPGAEDVIPKEFWSCDSAQCGYDRHGEIVLYDI